MSEFFNEWKVTIEFFFGTAVALLAIIAFFSNRAEQRLRVDPPLQILPLKGEPGVKLFRLFNPGFSPIIVEDAEMHLDGDSLPRSLKGKFIYEPDSKNGMTKLSHAPLIIKPGETRKGSIIDKTTLPGIVRFQYRTPKKNRMLSVRLNEFVYFANEPKSVLFRIKDILNKKK